MLFFYQHGLEDFSFSASAGVACQIKQPDNLKLIYVNYCIKKYCTLPKIDVSDCHEWVQNFCTD